MVGSKIIDWAMGETTKGELMKVTMTWRQVHFGASVQYCQYTWQYQCQGTLYVGSCACGANPRPPVAYIGGADYNLQRIASRVLLDTHLFVKFKCSFCQNPHQGSGWPGCACQPSTTGGPPSRKLGGPPATPKRDESWRP